MLIRPESPADVPAIRALTEAAFAGAPHSDGAEGAIVDALRAAGVLSISLVAERRGRLVGHVAFSPVRIGGRDIGWFGLGPASVLPGFQRQGFGTALIGAGLDALRRRGAKGCVVLGDPAYYRRFGFAADPGLRFGGAPPAYFQSLPLAGAPARGEVRFHEGFEAR